MLVAYADELVRYTPRGEKTILLDGSRLQPPLPWLVAVAVDRRGGDVRVSDVRGKRVIACRPGAGVP